MTLQPLAPTAQTATDSEPVLVVHGPDRAERPLVLDSPHSGFEMPADFGAALDAQALRDGEDRYIDELWQPATGLGIPLLAARFPRTYLDVNRHAADIDPELLDAPWPHPLVPSGKDRLGKALLWRLLDDGRSIYGRKLSVAEVQRRIERCHRPYHERLRQLIEAAHARFGVVLHLNCHSMNDVGGTMGEGTPGLSRADFVLGDRDGSACSAELTGFVRDHLREQGYEVKINDPFKGVELVRAFSDPARGRHSLQVEINKRLYLEADGQTRRPHFAVLQRQMLGLLQALDDALGGALGGALGDSPGGMAGRR